MYESFATSAVASPTPNLFFRCSVCQKSFDKKTSRDRHRRRCSQKKFEDSIPRKKACLRCTQSKTRCDLATPECGRCNSKGIQCQYVGKSYLTQQQQQQWEVIRKRKISNLSTPPEIRGEYGLEFHGTVGLGDGDLLGGEFEDMEINMAEEALDWSGLQISIPKAICGMFESRTLVSAMSNSTTNTSNQLDIARLQYQTKWTPEPDCRVLTYRAYLEATRCLAPTAIDAVLDLRTVFVPLSSEQINLMARAVQAYPKMMMHAQRSTLPPFIHPEHLFPGRTPEPLAICLTLLQMYRARTAENKGFVLACISREQDRLLREDGSCHDELKLLSSLQAVLIYVILRYFDEDPTQGSQIDYPALTKMEKKTFELCSTRLLCTAELEARRPTWSEWIIAESKRRTIMVAYIFDMIFNRHKDFPAPDCEGLSEMPLPAVSSLWSATKKGNWEEEYDVCLEATGGNGFPTLKDLWKDTGAECRAEVLENWFSGMDAFGVVVMGGARKYCSPRNGELA